MPINRTLDTHISRTRSYIPTTIRTNEGKLRTFSAPFHWVWPTELDLMARLPA